MEGPKSVSPSDIVFSGDYVEFTGPTQDSSTAPTETVIKPSAQTGVNKKMSDDNPSLIEFSQDLNDAVAPDPLPVSEYPATIAKAEVKTSANSGNRYLALTFRIDPEAYPADFTDGSPEGEMLTYNRLVLEDTGRGRWRLRKFLEAVGGPLGSSLDPNALMGLTATVGVTHGTWEGEKRAEISKIVST